MDRAPVSQQLSALWPSSRSTRADSLDAFKFYNCQWDYYEYLVDYLNSYGCSVSKAMSDYDDLYSNSFTFDEDVEASLQRAESEFFTAQQPRPTLTAPPFKKLKTDHNWASSSNSTHVPQSSQKSQGWRQALREQVKNTKAIGSGQGGGSYSASSNPSPTALSKPQNPPLSQKSSSMSSNDAHTHRSNLRRVSSKTEAFQSEPLRLSTSTANNTVQEIRATSSARMQQRPAQLSCTPDQQSMAVIYPQGFSHDAIPPVSEQDLQLQTELEELRNQLAKLAEEHAKAQRSLQEAQEIRYAKEGEVSILRKGIEKVAQEHAADVAKLKAAKEDAEAMRVRMQREMKEEVERLRTQFVFKQHEIESSARKPNMSVRSRRTMNGPPPTPVPIPPAMRSWGSRINGTQAATKRTPTKPQGRPAVYFATPRHEDVKSVPEQPVFKGFENSFMQASPARSPSKPKGRAYARGSSPLVEYSDMYVPDKKGKGKEKLPPIVNSPSFFKVAQSTQKQKQNEFVEPNDDIEMGDISPPRLNIDRSSPGVDTADMSVAGETDVLDDADTISRDDLEPLEAMDWTEEFKRLLLTHFSKSSSTLTIHVLLSVSVSNSTYRNSANSYQAACTGLLECIASRHYSLESTSTTAAQCFITMLRVLVEVVDFKALMALMALMTSCCLCIPNFTAELLKIDLMQHGLQISSLCALLSDVVRDFLKPLQSTNESDDKARLDLAFSVVNLFDAVCWSVSDSYIDRLAVIIRRDRVFMTLFDEKQPSTLTTRALQSLVMFAYHGSLFRSFLAHPIPDGERSPLPNPDFSRLPLIERISVLLIDPSTNNDTQSATSILTFVSLLCLAHPDALVILNESLTLIPSMIHYLNTRTALLWEEDEPVMNSPEAATSTVRVINQTLYLLHRMVFTPRPIVNLRHKLYYAPQRQFNGLNHLFVVTMGRLSYADPAAWLSEPLKAEMEALAEPARDLLELIVEGPEGDSIWEAYQGGNEDESAGEAMEEDEEEVQARHMDANEI